MLGYLRDQWNFVKDAVSNSHPGANPAGMQQLAFEETMDGVAEAGMGLAKKALPLAVGAGALYGAYNLANHQDIGPGFMAGASLIGGTAFGAYRGLLNARNLSTITGVPLSKTVAAKFMLKGAGIGGMVGMVGAGAALGGATGHAGMGAALGLGVAGAAVLAPKLAPTFFSSLTGNALKRVGGIGGLGLGAVGVGTGILGGITKLLQGTEMGARMLFTGSPIQAMKGKGLTGGMLDSWFPNFRNLKPIHVEHEFTDLHAFKNLRRAGKSVTKAAEAALIKPGVYHDPRRFAPNPRIGRRIVGVAAVGAYASMVNEAISPAAPPPTAHFDGRYMRHINDMGADAHYGQAVLGTNSALQSVDYRTLTRTALMTL